MYRKQLLTLLLTTVIAITHAQTTSLQFGAGMQHTHLLDRQASPLLYQTNEQTFTANFEREIRGIKMQIHADGSIGSLFPTGLLNRQLYNSDGSHTTDSSFLIGTFYNARLHFGYSKAISNGLSTLFGKNLKYKSYAGASMSDQLFYTDNIVRVGWLNSLSMNAEFEHSAVFHEKHLLNIKVTIPVAAFNTRLPYHNTISSPTGDSEYETFFKGGTRFVTLADYQNIQLTTGYQYMLTKKWGVGARYFGQWLHYSYRKPITLYQSQFAISASIHY